ncbi:MAG: hypothetical protein Q8P17_01165 [bacterium]|nr:hypothetical protein [bacterium]
MQVVSLWVVKEPQNKAFLPKSNISWHNTNNTMDNDPELDPIRKVVDEDALLEDLAEEFTNGDPDEALARAEELGYDIDDLPL